MNYKFFKKFIRTFIPKQTPKVNLFIVGAQKAGTSALHNYLVKHNKVIGGVKKEINYFNHEENYQKGYKWYHKNFKAPLFYKSKYIYIDSTPQYLNNELISNKIYNYNSNAKIVILLREPVSRAYSAWNMYKQFSKLSLKEKEGLIDRHICNKDKEKFKNFINQIPFPKFDEYVNFELNENKLMDYYPNILKRGMYYNQVKEYVVTFGMDNILIIESDFFKDNRIEVVKNVLSFLKISEISFQDNDLKDVHSRKYDLPIDSEIQKKLKSFYKPHNENLFELINKKFNW